MDRPSGCVEKFKYYVENNVIDSPFLHLSPIITFMKTLRQIVNSVTNFLKILKHLKEFKFVRETTSGKFDKKVKEA